MSGLLQAARPLARDVVAGTFHRLGITRPARGARDLLTIVTFHRVLPAAVLADYPIAPIAVSDEEFRWLVSYFARSYTCATLAEAHRRYCDGERPAQPFLAITFDDGQLDNALHARPILDAAGLRASFFVPVDAVDGGEPLWHDRLGYAARRLLLRDRSRGAALLAPLGDLDGEDDATRVLDAVERSKTMPPAERLALVRRIEEAAGHARPEWDGMMNWDQLRSLARGGHEVGSHSLTHAILTQVDDAQLERETRGSRERLSAELGLPCESFCYPNGSCDERVAAAARRAGYLRAVTTAWGANAAGGDSWRLRRCDTQASRVRDRAGRLSEPRLAFRMSRHFRGPIA